MGAAEHGEPPPRASAEQRAALLHFLIPLDGDALLHNREEDEMLLRRATALRCWDEEHTGTTQNTFNRDAELHLASPAGHSRKRPTLMVHSPIPSCNANCVCYLRLGVFTVSLEWMPLKRYTVSTVLPASVGTAAVRILLHVMPRRESMIFSRAWRSNAMSSLS